MEENNNVNMQTPEQPQQNAPQQQNQNNNLNSINIPQNAVRTEIQTPPKGDVKFGSMLTTILCFIFGLLCLAGAYLFYLQIYIESGSAAAAAIAVIMFILIYGWFTIIPALILAIVGIVFGAIGKQSVKKGNRVTSVIFMILNIILLIMSVISLFLLGSIHS